MREICLVNTISIVLYPDRHIPLVEAAGQTELAVGVPQTVGQYICNRPAHLCVVTFDHDGFFGEIRHNGDAALCGSRFYGANAVVEQFPKIHLGKHKPLPAHIESGDIQKFIHQFRHTVAFC